MKNKGKGKGTTTTTASVREVAAAAGKQKAPAHTVNNMLEIEKYFNARILDQPTSIRRLSVTISAILHNSKPIMKGEEALLYMITFAGPSGTGKTETVTHMRHFMGMDEDYEYSSQFIAYDAASGGNSADMMMCYEECNTGGNALLQQKESQDILARLNKAVEDYHHQDEGKKTGGPPYIMLYIHDYEHAAPSFKFIVNSLISSGQYKTPQGAQFIVPKETSLIVVCTSHYGGNDIMEMEERCDDTAKQYIRRAMEQSNPNVQRRNLLLPYYPLSNEVLKELLHSKLERYIGCSTLLKSLGIEVLNCTLEMKEMLIKHVLVKIDKRHGMHSGERMLRDKLDVLFETGRAMIELDRDRKKEPIFLDSFTLDTHLFGALLEQEELEGEGGARSASHDIVRTIKDNPENKQYLARCDPALNGVVEAVGMRYGAKPVCGLIMNVTYINITNIYETDETTKILRDNNKKLKKCLIAINAAVVEKKDAHKAIEDIIKNHHELLNESSDDSGDDHHKKNNTRRALSGQSVVADDLTRKRKADVLTTPTNTVAEEQQACSSNKKTKRSHTSSASSTTTSSEIDEEESESEEEEEEEEDEETRDARIEAEIENFFSDEESMFSTSDISFTEVFQSDDDNEEAWEFLPPKPKKRGRPLKTIEGFKRLENGARNVSYQCLRCDGRISKPSYARTHRCRAQNK